ncbi:MULTISPECIES: glycoside hydrolase domain-containing protein [Streptomyces]|nr:MULTISPECIES: glycoside hydrolase domain-containing protein [Streptomyces]
MDPRKKIIGYLVALMAALAQVVVLALPAPAAPVPAEAAGPSVYRGRGFDTCQAPPLTTLSAWGAAATYGAVGVYYGGRARACPRQRYLSHRWLTGARDLGWRVLPVFVGSQSPCVGASSKDGFPIGDDPWGQGTDEGHEAVRTAADLGIAAGSPLYYDMEAYDYRDEECADITLTFVQAWSSTVKSHGYIPGFYSSAASGVRHMEVARRAGEGDLPEILWFARWRVPASTARERVLSAGSWAHRRIHQYAGNVTETHGGRKLTIDRNLVDAPVAVIRD